MGAQVNAFFFDGYQPLFDALGTYISQMHDEHGVGNPSKPSGDEKTEIQE